MKIQAPLVYILMVTAKLTVFLVFFYREQTKKAEENNFIRPIKWTSAHISKPYDTQFPVEGAKKWKEF